MIQPHFAVDKKGLAKLLARRGIEFAVLELVQNALDENVTTVHVSLAPSVYHRGYYHLEVQDDSPDGFADLRHAYTLFAESKKKTDATKRGRFNLGEKLVIAVAKETTIVTTTGTVRFDDDGRSVGRGKRERGSKIVTVLRMTHEEADRTRAAVHSVLVPPTVALTLDGQRQPSREPITVLTEVTLPTEVADDDGYLRPTQRKTTIEVYEPRAGETPTLYELGIPVVATGDRWHVSIGQKVPLNSDRDNVTPSYLRRVRAEVVNARPDLLTREISSSAWVTDVLASELASPEAVTAIVAQRYGDKRVIRDPSDPEATKIAVSMGYAVIEPGSFSKAAWDNIRSAGAALPAGQVTPSPKPYSEDGEQLEFMPREKWTPGMIRFAALAGRLASLAGVLPPDRLELNIATEVTWPFAATYARGGQLVVNLGRVGHRFFDATGRDADLDRVRLLIHEFGHEYSLDHLSSEYHEALCKIGARLFLGAS